jgi:hypothetical protein
MTDAIAHFLLVLGAIFIVLIVAIPLIIGRARLKKPGVTGLPANPLAITTDDAIRQQRVNSIIETTGRPGK